MPRPGRGAAARSRTSHQDRRGAVSAGDRQQRTNTHDVPVRRRCAARVASLPDWPRLSCSTAGRTPRVPLSCRLSDRLLQQRLAVRHGSIEIASRLQSESHRASRRRAHPSSQGRRSGERSSPESDDDRVRRSRLKVSHSLRDVVVTIIPNLGDSGRGGDRERRRDDTAGRHHRESVQGRHGIVPRDRCDCGGRAERWPRSRADAVCFCRWSCSSSCSGRDWASGTWPRAGQRVHDVLLRSRSGHVVLLRRLRDRHSAHSRTAAGARAVGVGDVARDRLRARRRARRSGGRGVTRICRLGAGDHRDRDAAACALGHGRAGHRVRHLSARGGRRRRVRAGAAADAGALDVRARFTTR